MDTVKETRNKEGPEKAAWKRDRYQLDLNARALECLVCAHPCPSGDLWTTLGAAPQVHVFFEMVNSLLSRLGWPATSPALGLGAAIPGLAF